MLDQRRLARSGGPDDANDVPLIDGEGDVGERHRVQRRALQVDVAQSFALNEGHVWTPGGTARRRAGRSRTCRRGWAGPRAAASAPAGESEAGRDAGAPVPRPG